MRRDSPLISDPSWLQHSSSKLSRPPYSPHIELKHSESAYLLSFSPSETSLIVASGISLEDEACFILYQLGGGSTPTLKVSDPIRFSLMCQGTISSMLWTADQRHFGVHVRGLDYLFTFARTTSDNFHRQRQAER